MYKRSEKLKGDIFGEECGVFGIYSDIKRHLAHTVYYGLYALQHRGQESAGIAVASDDKIEYIKAKGLVSEVFQGDALASIPEGDIAIGHVRYSPSKTRNHVSYNQPLVYTGKAGKIAAAMNGKLVNARELRDGLIAENVIFQAETSVEVVTAVINKHTEGKNIEEAVIKAANEIKGAYALVIMTTNKLIGVRDPFGISPLCLGRLNGEYILASETCALDALNAELIKEVEPGEIITIDYNGVSSRYLENRGRGACIFEYVYFARPDSYMDGCSVSDSRMTAGRLLAEKYPAEADIVAGVPDSAVLAARGYAEQSGIPYVEALNKNRYVGRTFIQPDQEMRENSVSLKLNAIKANIKGKRIVLIDDSIVRGTTSRKIVELLKKMGAKEVHLRICSPVVKHPCYFGIDTQNYGQLIGARMSKEEINKYIGSDSLEYLEAEDLLCSVGGKKSNYCLGCFTGEYPFEFVKR